MPGKGQHVVPRDSKWAVRRTGAAKVTRRFDTQKEAISVAREFARHQKTDVFIHGRDGRIRKLDSSGNATFQRKG